LSGWLIKQWLATLLLGAVNIEQTKLLDFADLGWLLGRTLRSPFPQRQQLSQLASGSVVPQRLSFNAQWVGAAQTRDSCWCPKAIAMIGKVPETLADRSIVVNMQRKLTAEKCAPLAEFNPAVIVQKCVRWANDEQQDVADWPRLGNEKLNDRASDTYEPLFVIGAKAGTVWEAKIRNAAEVLCAYENTEPEAASLILDIMGVFITTEAKRVFSKDLAEALKGKSGWVKVWSKVTPCCERRSCNRFNRNKCNGVAGVQEQCPLWQAACPHPTRSLPKPVSAAIWPGVAKAGRSKHRPLLPPPPSLRNREARSRSQTRFVRARQGEIELVSGHASKRRLGRSRSGALRTTPLHPQDGLQSVRQIAGSTPL
jgi:hypothetical protein